MGRRRQHRSWNKRQHLICYVQRHPNIMAYQQTTNLQAQLGAHENVREVFGKPELMEIILLHLPLRDLVTTHCVCKDFEGTARGSSKIRRVLFLEPFSALCVDWARWSRGDRFLPGVRQPHNSQSHDLWIAADNIPGVIGPALRTAQASEAGHDTSTGVLFNPFMLRHPPMLNPFLNKFAQAADKVSFLTPQLGEAEGSSINRMLIMSPPAYFLFAFCEGQDSDGSEMGYDIWAADSQYVRVSDVEKNTSRHMENETSMEGWEDGLTAFWPYCGAMDIELVGENTSGEDGSDEASEASEEEGSEEIYSEDGQSEYSEATLEKMWQTRANVIDTLTGWEVWAELTKRNQLIGGAMPRKMRPEDVPVHQAYVSAEKKKILDEGDTEYDAMAMRWRMTSNSLAGSRV